jgi:diguanylate cyclase
LPEALPSDIPLWLEESARPLLNLVQHLTGVETAFITSIDWNSFSQEVLMSNHDGRVPIVEGSVLDWSDSMCRHMFTRGKEQSDCVDTLLPDSVGAGLGMKSFFVFPIEHQNKTLGTLCGASETRLTLTENQSESMRLISGALSHQLSALLEMQRLQDAYQSAEKKVAHLERQAKSLKIEAETDHLTGLLNRRGFARHFQALIDQRTPDETLGVIIIDIDFFKLINDERGHEFGDQVLVELASRINEGVGPNWLVCRAGGDEFIIAARGANAEDLKKYTTELMQSFGSIPAIVTLGGLASISAGLATTEQCPEADLLREADTALYRSKNSGRNMLSTSELRPV